MIIKKRSRIKVPKVLFIVALLLVSRAGFGQLGFFEDYWQPKSAITPAFDQSALPSILPDLNITVDLTDTINKISPYVGGYNTNTYYGGNVYDQPDLLRHLKSLDLPVFRYPGGSGSMWYFWDHARPNLPDSVDYLTIKEETFHISQKIRWGDKPGEDYFSLDNSYILRDSLKNEAIHVVNYAYARYGRSVDPVAQAAHYAADWVRYDNGRTRFWEIGNENYGVWEPSWIIDTARNLDGQPRQITGTLYGEHCLVFLDSMRAAAAEIGADIKIGATLGFQETREEWDVELIKVLKDEVDFYIVHKYFGNDQNAQPTELFNSIDEFYQHKAHVDNLISLHSPSYVPLVMTEWNTRYSGSKQNVSCANGMHTVLGYKAIINEGVGLSMKWNLLWGYQDGNTHGLISNEKDDPSIEGIPKYFPRAPFMYQYFFKKFLGDISVGNQYEEGEDIDVFSSSYTSGNAGLVILNKSGDEKRVVVNLENFDYGDRFYWYSLTPSEGGLYDPKVSVNGLSNEYEAGGPLNYEDILAYSAGTEHGVRLDLEPYSATYILAEGNKLVEDKSEEVTFRIYSRKDGIIALLENAVVQVGEHLYLTDEKGEVQISRGLGPLNYLLKANGHDNKASVQEITGTMVIIDTLDFARYDVQFELVDALSQMPITECNVTLMGETKSVSAEGKIDFPQVNFGTYQVGINSKPYKEVVQVEIYSDSMVKLELTQTDYLLKFAVKDKYSGSYISGAKVTFNGEAKYTTLSGEVEFLKIYGSYNYSVESSTYKTLSSNFELLNDTVVTAELSQEFANIKFKVYNGGAAVNGAQIDLNGDIQSSNVIGIVNYYDKETEVNYNFTISHDTYGDLDGSFILLADTTITLDYSLSSKDVVFQIIDSKKDFPVASSQVVFDAIFKQADAEGKVSYSVPAGQYELMVTKDRYSDYSATIEIFKDTLQQIHIDLEEAIIKFRVADDAGLLEGASVEMNNETKNTNILGIAVFSNIAVDQTYDYTVSNGGYLPLESSFFADHDSTLEISLVKMSEELWDRGSVRIYPQPSSDKVTIESSIKIMGLYIVDMNGRVLDILSNRDGEKLILDVSQVEAGIYLIKMTGEDHQVFNAKLIITSR